MLAILQKGERSMKNSVTVLVSKKMLLRQRGEALVLLAVSILDDLT